MTQKHFEHMASMIANMWLNFRPESLKQIPTVQLAFEEVAREFNSKFDKDKFRARIDQRVATKNPWGPLSGRGK